MADESEKGYASQLDKATRQIVGAGDHEVVDLTNAGAVDYVEPAMKNCRFFEVDVEGIIKFEYETNNSLRKTRVMYAQAGINRYRNIKKVYLNYKAASACSTQSYKDDGTLVSGITLCR